MIAIKMLQAAERAAGRWPSRMPGKVNFGDEAPDVEGQLEDGAHRLEGSPWQFIVEGGKLVAAVREDMAAWWRADHTVYAVEEAGEAGAQTAQQGNPATGAPVKPVEAEGQKPRRAGEQEAGTLAG